MDIITKYLVFISIATTQLGPASSAHVRRFHSDCNIKCSKKVQPVCGTDGKEYINECLLFFLNCQSSHPVTVKHEGACWQGAPCPSSCPLHYAPVCGSDGRTYGNECDLHLHNCNYDVSVSVAWQGNCDCPTLCPSDISSPVCGSDGRTYTSMCHLTSYNCRQQVVSVRKLYSGECGSSGGPIKKCRTDCPKINRPVCGTDGNSYTNICQLRKRSCLYDSSLELAFPGRCEIFKMPPFICPSFNCPLVTRPVCASNQQTFSSRCQLLQYNCYRYGKKTFSVEYEGECEQSHPNEIPLL